MREFSQKHSDILFANSAKLREEFYAFFSIDK